jgi:hypothetical protein
MRWGRERSRRPSPKRIRTTPEFINSRAKSHRPAGAGQAVCSPEEDPEPAGKDPGARNS